MHYGMYGGMNRSFEYENLKITLFARRMTGLVVTNWLVVVTSQLSKCIVSSLIPPSPFYARDRHSYIVDTPNTH